ncbi:major facilitator superfamily domain-containing protein [Mycena maculata]|uniref:Major facilitator superfamily domain-containing protein n=1 Tax=Mycena maculata TaxID=230809 RepID=A0AAD7NQX8_9AGAR|nr:major facilitator superfamily domain-containing protein [Mycena maculata]
MAADPVELDKQQTSDITPGLSSKHDRRLLRRIDYYLMPLLCITYGLQYSDKTSLSSGVVFGLRADTHLVGQQYAMLSTLFYLGYLLAELPMSFALQRFPLGRFLSLTCVAWGTLVMCLGACTDFTQLAAIRFLLGVCESAVTPGFLMISACWYKRSEMTSRTLAWMAMNTVFSSFFGLVIYALAKRARDSDGLAAWRVINLFLGACTVVDGLVLSVFLGTPNEVWWLSADQKQAVRDRIASNGNGDGAQREWKWDQVKECFKDPQIWLFFSFNIIATIPSGSLATFGPLVYVSFGFTNLETILYALPNSAVALAWLLFVTLAIKKVPAARFPLMVFSVLPPFIGLLSIGLLSTSTDKWLKWGLYTMTATFTVPTFLAWTLIPLNLAGRTKKTVISASTFISYCAGQIIGTQVFRDDDAPRYVKGLTIISGIFGVQIIITIAWKLYYYFENARRDRAQVAAGISDQQNEALNEEAGATDKTDLENRSFRYIWTEATSTARAWPA